MRKVIRHPDGTTETITGSPEEIRRYETRITGAGRTTYDGQGCLIAGFFRDNPNAKFCNISCPCPRCSPRCSA